MKDYILKIEEVPKKFVEQSLKNLQSRNNSNVFFSYKSKNYFYMQENKPLSKPTIKKIVSEEMNKLKKELLEEIKKSMPLMKNHLKKKSTIGMKFKTLKKKIKKEKKDSDEAALLKYFT